MEIQVIRESSTCFKYLIKSAHATGYALLEYHSPVGWTITLAQVKPERKGYGGILLSQIIQDLRKKGAKVLSVFTLTPQGRQFCQANGFSNSGGSYHWLNL